MSSSADTDSEFRPEDEENDIASAVRRQNAQLRALAENVAELVSHLRMRARTAARARTMDADRRRRNDSFHLAVRRKFLEAWNGDLAALQDVKLEHLAFLAHLMDLPERT